MKNIVKFFVFMIATIGIQVSVSAQQFTVDNTQSIVKWNGKKVTGEHFGTIKIQSGTLEVKNNAVASAQVSMDMNSIVCEDLTDAGVNAKLVGHLKSDDFFSVEKFPVSKLSLTGVKKLTGNDYEFTGDLTIKGITHPVTFKATSALEGSQLKSAGKIVVNRAKYDIRYGSGSFFTGLGDKMIYDDFTLDFTLVAKRN